MTIAPAEVPSGIAEINPEWLTAALRADSPLPNSLRINDLRVQRIAEDSGFSSLLYRLSLDATAGVPSTLIAKLPAESEARAAMDLLGGYRREITFYREVATRSPMDTPVVYSARMADESADFVLLLEDLQGWDNADHLAGLPLDRARLAIEQLAGLHAWSVRPANVAALQSFPSLDAPAVRDLLLPAFEPGWQIYRERTSLSVPRAVARFADRFGEYAGQALSSLAEHTMLLHGDIRADNLFFDGDRLKVVDFQFAATGSGIADIAYLVSQGLRTEVRRGHDEALVHEYLQQLAARGVTGYTFDDAWRRYRYGVAYFMVLPVITLLGWDGLPPRSRALCLELTDRAIAAISDTDALEVFE
ncbi:ecdysteroid 22-kinase family protein [Mycobacterium sp. SMC-4]|uniref:ecdysteroid 22-kinase family protein n=1 Tax=Mycobacterium sp. SMC-4 TaxID=2857059 RepID=UPI0021B4C092|nr:ecdysteroid 22-kinase family protein [Mycobacterium sp. SMC-4]UXA19641.1 ecdysteroid 22-kinase family protein [Mycobacterium sp. SMC-4]